MSDGASVQELEATLASSPTNHAVRRDLIDLLLTERQLTRAAEHFHFLLSQLPNEEWVLQFGIEVMTVTGDSLAAARLKKRWRDLQSLDGFDDDGVGSPSAPHPGHPSQDKVSVRHLSLVTAISGGELAHDNLGCRTSLRLPDITGLAAVKKRLRKIINRVRAGSMGNGWAGGLLLYGPPSCGKAFCGEVVAGELDSSFWYVDLEQGWSTSDLNKVITSAAEQGTTEAPSVLYLDNIDSVSRAEIHAVVPALSDVAIGGQAIIFGAATYPWLVSSDLVSPEHISDVLLVLPPDAPARRRFLQNRISERTVVDVKDLDWLTEHTEGHSFADLERLVDLAVLLEHSHGDQISHDSLRAARRRVSSSSAQWLTAAGHHAIMSKRGGLYDDLIAYFTNRQKA